MHRSAYIQGWYEKDATMLIDSTRDDFVFDDPREPQVICKDGLVDYMQRWNDWTRKLGGSNEWKLTHEVRQDKNGIITDWEWWELINTPIQGAAMVLTSNDGVFLEKITYFDRHNRVNF